MNKKLKTLFMGTSKFAVPILKGLIDNNYPIIGVFCQSDKPVGRKKIITPPPIKDLAIISGIYIFQPPNLQSPEIIKKIKELNPELIVVSAYGHILPEDVLNIPEYGCINIHASILPKYRGAAPIQWAIVNGELETGVTIMLMDKGIDTGDILNQKSIKIEFEDNFETLSNKLSLLGKDLLLETLPLWIQKKIIPQKQNHNMATPAPIIKKEDGKIDWSKSALEIYNKLRGFYPWPGIYTEFENKRLKILKAIPLQENSTSTKYGQIVNITKEYIDVNTGDKILRLLEVQPEGKKVMKAGDFSRGYKVTCFN